MSTINNIYELQAEIRRLEIEVINREKDLRSDILELKASLSPAMILQNALTRIASGPEENGKIRLTSRVIKAGALLFLQRFLLKSEEKLESKVLELLGNGFFKIREWIRGMNRKNEKLVAVAEDGSEGEEN